MRVHVNSRPCPGVTCLAQVRSNRCAEEARARFSSARPNQRRVTDPGLHYNIRRWREARRQAMWQRIRRNETSVDAGVCDHLWRNLQRVRLDLEIDFGEAFHPAHQIAIERIRDREFRFKPDDYGRLHTNLTNLSKALRQYLAVVRFDLKHQKRGERNRGDSTGPERQSCLPLTRLPTDTPLFTVPDKLVQILDRDLRLAGIPKVDERGRTVDVHAFRHTFGTLLSANGVMPRTAQAAMRHSTIDLTMNTYTDPKLLDVAGAMQSLPALPLVGREASEAIAVRATGTDNSAPSPLVPTLVPTTGKTCIRGSILDKVGGEAGKARDAGAVTASAYPVKRNNPLTSAVNGSYEEPAKGVEPLTPALRMRCSAD